MLKGYKYTLILSSFLLLKYAIVEAAIQRSLKGKTLYFKNLIGKVMLPAMLLQSVYV